MSINSTTEFSEQTTTAADGKRSFAFEGSNELGGELGIGFLKASSSRKEGLSTQVDSEGNMSGDLSSTFTESNMEKKAASFWNNLKNDTLSTLTGGSKAKGEDKTGHGMILSDDDYRTILARASDRKAWTKLNDKTSLWEDWQQCRREILAADYANDKPGVARALAKFMAKSGQGRESLMEHAVRDWGSDQGGSRYEFPGDLAYLKDSYVAYAVGDPLEAVQVKLAEKDLVGAFKAGSKALVKLNDMHFALTNAQDQFNPGILAEMILQIGKRRHALRLMMERVKAAQAGKAMSTDEAEGVLADDHYRQLIADCKTFKAQEIAAFERIEETFSDGHTGTGELISNTEETVKLNQLYLKWDKVMSELSALDIAYGLSESSSEWRKYAPSKTRFKAAVAGKAPSSYSYDQEHQDMLDTVRAEKQGMEIFHNSQASVEARAQYEGKQAAAARKVERSEATKVWDPQIKAIRDKAFAGGGMCNGMNASGRQAEIKPEAQKAWGEAFTKLALGQKAQSQYSMVASHPDAVKLAVDNAANNVIALYNAAIVLFSKGNAAQKA